MFKAFLPPFCLLLALALAITGFSMIAFGGPEESISLHEARASGDDLTQTTLELDLKQRQTSRVVMIGLLFAGSAAMTLIAFGSMSGPGPNRQQPQS